MASVSSTPEYSLTNYYKKVVDDIEGQRKGEIGRIKEQHAEALGRQEKAYADDLYKKSAQAEQLLADSNDSHAENLSNLREQHRSEVDELKANYNRKGEMGVPREVYNKDIQALNDAIELRRKTDNKVVDDVRDSYQTDVNRMERKHDEQVRVLRDAQVREVRDKNDQIRDLSGYNKELDQKQGEYLANLNRESDSMLKAESRRLTDSYERNLSALKQSGDEREDYYTRQNRDVLRKQEQVTAEMIKNMNQDHHSQVQELQDTFKTQIDRFEKQRHDDQEKASESLHNQLNESNMTREEALRKKSEDFRVALDDVRKTDDQKIETLQKALQTQKTSSDTFLVSPAAEEAIRKAILTDNEKAMQVQIDKEKINHENLMEKYANSYRTALEEFEDKATTTAQETNRDRATERNQYINTITDTEYHANQRMKELVADQDREQESLKKQFGVLLERQRKEYDHIFEAAKAEASIRLSNSRADGEAALRDQQRDSRTRQNELIRDYEKKLTDQKRDYEVIIEDLKSQTQVTIGEMDRKAKADLDVQARGFEQRIAQLEAQNKERERVITESLQDELDKTRHSYELQARKRSGSS